MRREENPVFDHECAENPGVRHKVLQNEKIRVENRSILQCKVENLHKESKFANDPLYGDLDRSTLNGYSSVELILSKWTVFLKGQNKFSRKGAGLHSWHGSCL